MGPAVSSNLVYVPGGVQKSVRGMVDRLILRWELRSENLVRVYLSERRWVQRSYMSSMRKAARGSESEKNVGKELG